MKSHFGSMLVVALLSVSSGPASAAEVTWNRDIAPIVWANCTGCHRAGEVGPFPLLTYKDAAKRAKFLAEVTETHQMPPWKAVEGFGKFHDERRLSAEQIALIKGWADAGAPEGDAKDLKEAPKFTDGWQLGKPDLIVKMSEAFTVPAGGHDLQHCFVLPLGLNEDRYVKAVEFRPGARTVVHHALLFLDNTGAARKKDEAYAGPGYKSFAGPGIAPTGSLGAWTPGATSRKYPEGIGSYLKKGSDLVVQIHYHPSGKEEKDESQVGIWFSDKPVEKVIGSIGLRSKMLLIPAGKADYKVNAKTDPLPVPVDVISVTPHMHNVGRKMRSWAVTPDGKEVSLIRIDDWDFNWQGSYRLAEPLRLPKGSVIHMEAVYDNSKDNPRNPSNPPKFVHWGEQTTDEMCLFGVQVVTDTRSDMKQIVSMRNAFLGGLLLGSPPKEILVDPKPSDAKGDKPADKTADKPTEKATESRFPKEGIVIPEKLKAMAKRLDTDGDGRLSKEEFDALPPALRERIEGMLQKK